MHHLGQGRQTALSEPASLLFILSFMQHFPGVSYTGKKIMMKNKILRMYEMTRLILLWQF